MILTDVELSRPRAFLSYQLNLHCLVKHATLGFGMNKNKRKRKAKILKYTAIFEPEEDGGYSVYVPSLPGCISQGDSFEKAATNIKEAIELYLEDIPQIDLDLLYTEASIFTAPVEVVLTR